MASMVRWVAVGIFWVFALAARAETVAYFYALDTDFTALKAGAKLPVVSSFNGQSIATLEVGGHRVHALKMGSGSVPTAAAAATLLAKYRCDVAISTGPAGRLSTELPIGAWVRVAEVVAFQEGQQSEAGFLAGRQAERALAEPGGGVLPEGWRKLRSIRLASGDAFIAAASYRDRLRATTHADAVDMNLAGLSAACARAGVPLRAWKVISDSADTDAARDFAAFVKTYRGEGGAGAAEYIRGLPANPSDVGSYSRLRGLIESGGE